MENGKIDTSLWLAYSMPENLRERSEGLNVGFNEETRQWELIVKYHGNLAQRREQIPFTVEFLNNGYAIVFLNEDDLVEFSNLEEVDYIEPPKRLWYSQTEGEAEICLNPLQQQTQLYGQGVIVAIIDSSVDYAHPDFLNPDGTTRILALWDQTIDSETLNGEDSVFFYEPPQGYAMGTLFTEEMINAALAKQDRRERLAIVPSVDLSGHGTHVAGIACGNGSASQGRYRGVAPLSKMLVVKLGDFSGVSFPRTTRLMEAVDFVVGFAEERGFPVAVNLSFGNNYGSHSGNDLVALYLDQIATRWKSVICTGMGNEGNTGRHKEGMLQNGEEQEVEMAISEGQEGFSVQLWKSYTDQFSLEIQAPDRETIFASLDRGRIEYREFRDCILAINFGVPGPFQLLQEVFMEWIPKGQSLDSGIWKFRLIPEKIVEGRYDFWMPAGTILSARTRFLSPSVTTTLTIPATTNRFISVGAYNGNTRQVAPFSGRGYTRNNQIKPDLVAPGVGIMSAAPNGGYAIRSGTSMATPFVTGAAALAMEYGIVRGNDPYLYGEKVKAYFRRGAKPLEGEGVPSNRQGFGTLCLMDSIPDLNL